MKRDKILYWIFTGLVSALFLFSSFMYLSKNPEMVATLGQLGFPLFFVMMLGVAKLTGAIALLLPKFKKLNEWAYAGFTFVLIGAIWTHLATGTPFIMPLVILFFLGASYWFRARITKAGTVADKKLAASFL